MLFDGIKVTLRRGSYEINIGRFRRRGFSASHKECSRYDWSNVLFHENN